MADVVVGTEDNKRKRMSVGLYVSCPSNIKQAIDSSLENGYHFIITQLTHPSYTREICQDVPFSIGRTDRVLKSSDWGRLVVGQITPTIDLDCEVEHVRENSKKLLIQELGFASHLGIPAIWISLTKSDNILLARTLYEKLILGYNYSVWVNVPMTHPSRFSHLAETEQDTWNWWNEFRTYCNYDKRLGLVLDLSDIKHILPLNEIKRWIGEPVRAIVIPTSYFLINQHGKPVLSRLHQDIIKKFMTLDVQYIIKIDTETTELSLYVRYLQFLGKKLFVSDTVTDFVQGFEDFLQNPLQPLTEHLETNIYEIFEKDNVKYEYYQKAVHEAVSNFPKEKVPVIMVVGAGRGPLVQAVINVGLNLNRKLKIYAVEKNPFAINTLIHRCNEEWENQVTIVKEDMRTYKPPEQADILVSELLGSFGDNELSPECIDGAQRFLKTSGISIPQSYTSYLAPLQSIKVFNEIRTNRPLDKTLQFCYETPYVTHLANYYEIALPQPLFTFTHPNRDGHNNERYKKLKFNAEQACLLTGFVGYFDTVLYKDVTLSIHPKTYTPDMVSWFPIVFSLENPIHVEEGASIEVSFWRIDSSDKVWYEWCVHTPVTTGIINPNGRSYFIKKH